MTNEDDDLEFGPLMPVGFDDCVIGLTTESCPAVIYDYDKVIKTLMTEEMGGMNYEDAVDYFQYNTVRGAQYEKGVSPIYIKLSTADEIHIDYEIIR